MDNNHLEQNLFLHLFDMMKVVFHLELILQNNYLHFLLVFVNKLY